MAMGLAVVGILYGAVLAFAQTDIKRLVAYTSVSHMGFVLLGIFAWNELALQGAVMIMLATASAPARSSSSSATCRSGCTRATWAAWAACGRRRRAWAASALFFAVASLGLPGLGNFVGEFLVLLGTYQTNTPMAVVATLGLIVSVVYSLWMIQVAFQGPNVHKLEAARLKPA